MRHGAVEQNANLDDADLSDRLSKFEKPTDSD